MNFLVNTAFSSTVLKTIGDIKQYTITMDVSLLKLEEKRTLSNPPLLISLWSNGS